MNPVNIYNEAYTRRQFFRKSGTGLGVAAMASLLGEKSFAAQPLDPSMMIPQIAPKAKRAIYISLIGAPSQFETFDYKPELVKRYKEDLKSYLAKAGERLTGMTSGQAAFPLAPSRFKFSQHGQSGTWVSELLPWHGKMADDLCVISRCTPMPSTTNPLTSSSTRAPWSTARPPWDHGCPTVSAR